MRNPLLSNKYFPYAVGLLLVVLFLLAFYVRHQRNAPSPAAFVLTAEEETAPATAAPIAISPNTPEKSKDNATKVLELFNPSDSALTEQINETTIAQQIEQVMATSFVLTNCGFMKEEGYRRSYRASVLYALRTKLAPDEKAATAAVRRITDSAGASYSLIYRRTKCDDPKLPTIAAQLQAWQEGYLHDDPYAARFKPEE